MRLSRKQIISTISSVVFACVILTLILVFIPKYKGPGKNCVFLNEKANLHNEYYITVTDFEDLDSVSILAHKEDLEETELIGTDKHYIAVNVLIEHINVSGSKENHVFDVNDFKIKDHAGVRIKNFNFVSIKDGNALADKKFTTTEAIKDYNWVNSNILPGEKKKITLYFEMPKEISVADTLIILEADLFIGASKGKIGTDIVLAKRV